MILIDAEPLVALVDADDRHHEKCVACLKTLREPLVTVWASPCGSCLFARGSSKSPRSCLGDVGARSGATPHPRPGRHTPHTVAHDQVCGPPDGSGARGARQSGRARRHPEDLHSGPQRFRCLSPSRTNRLCNCPVGASKSGWRRQLRVGGINDQLHQRLSREGRGKEPSDWMGNLLSKVLAKLSCVMPSYLTGRQLCKPGDQEQAEATQQQTQNGLFSTEHFRLRSAFRPLALYIRHLRRRICWIKTAGQNLGFLSPSSSSNTSCSRSPFRRPSDRTDH